MKNERNGRHRRRALPKFAPSLLRIATFFGRLVMSDGVRKLVTFAHSREVPVFQSSYRDAPFFSRVSCDDWSRVYRAKRIDFCQGHIFVTLDLVKFHVSTLSFYRYSCLVSISLHWSILYLFHHHLRHYHHHHHHLQFPFLPLQPHSWQCFIHHLICKILFNSAHWHLLRDQALFGNLVCFSCWKNWGVSSIVWDSEEARQVLGAW